LRNPAGIGERKRRRSSKGIGERSDAALQTLMPAGYCKCNPRVADVTISVTQRVTQHLGTRSGRWPHRLVTTWLIAPRMRHHLTWS